MDEKWNFGSALPSMASYNGELTVEFRLHQRDGLRRREATDDAGRAG